MGRSIQKLRRIFQNFPIVTNTCAYFPSRVSISNREELVVLDARMFKRQSSVPTKGLLAATTEADENSADGEDRTGVVSMMNRRLNGSAASDGDVEDEFGEVTLQEEAQRRLAEAGAITILSCDDVVKNHEVLEKVLDSRS